MKTEQLLKELRGKVVVGVDEVGRGCWAGPLVVGAVILDKPIGGLLDSKKLSPIMRKELSLVIRRQAAASSTGWAEPGEVDELGLTAATKLAIERAIESIAIYDHLLIDGSVNFLKENPKAVTLIKADALVPAVSAASILAKVARDEYMAEQSLHYPGYHFDEHVGYGTRRHRQAIIEHGLTPLHRRNFEPIRSMTNA